MSLKINQYDIWLADLSPKMGTESGKTRPVVVVQTNLLNHIDHPSTLIVPCTTHLLKHSAILRIRIQASSDQFEREIRQSVPGLHPSKSGLEKDSELMMDQLRSIDNRRLIQKLGTLPSAQIEQVKKSLEVVLDLT